MTLEQAPKNDPEAARRLRTFVEKDFAHVENLFAVARRAFLAGDVRLAANYVGALASETAALCDRVRDLDGVMD